jgi:hypothetical protein
VTIITAITSGNASFTIVRLKYVVIPNGAAERNLLSFVASVLPAKSSFLSAFGGSERHDIGVGLNKLSLFP